MRRLTGETLLKAQVALGALGVNVVTVWVGMGRVIFLAQDSAGVIARGEAGEQEPLTALRELWLDVRRLTGR